MATICPYSEDFQKAVSRQRQKGSESERVADRTKYFEVLLLAERPCRIMRVCKDLESWSQVVEGVEMSIERLNTGMLVFSVTCISDGSRSLFTISRSKHKSS